jgi:uncharacterized protein with PQ loop repeat
MTTHIIPILSFLAVILGLFSAIPQIVAMLRHKNAAGQSTSGWLIGLITNTIMAYVNLVGLHISVLGIGNIVSATLCAMAAACTVRLPKKQHFTILEMPTQEFEIIKDLVAQRDER